MAKFWIGNGVAKRISLGMPVNYCSRSARLYTAYKFNMDTKDIQRWGFGQGNSFWSWQFLVSMLDFRGVYTCVCLVFQKSPSKLQKLHRSHQIPGTCKKFEKKLQRIPFNSRLRICPLSIFGNKATEATYGFQGAMALFQGQTCNGNPDKWMFSCQQTVPSQGL